MEGSGDDETVACRRALLSTFYGVKTTFPWDCVFVRSENNHVGKWQAFQRQNLWLVHAKTAKLLADDALHVVATGVKLFEFNARTAECPFRLCQEGVRFIRPFLSKRVLAVSLEDYRKVLETQTKPTGLEVFSEAFRESVKEVSVGACVMELDETSKRELAQKRPALASVFEEMLCVIWRGAVTWWCGWDVRGRVHVLASAKEIRKMGRILSSSSVC